MSRRFSTSAGTFLRFLIDFLHRCSLLVVLDTDVNYFHSAFFELLHLVVTRRTVRVRVINLPDTDDRAHLGASPLFS